MSTFVRVPAEALIGFLQAKGFTERPTRGVEIVYERRHERDPRYRVLVYTSVRKGRHVARARGTDAIRVCAIIEWRKGDGPRFTSLDGTTGIAKLPRVHRTGSVEAVLERVLERAREAYRRCNEEIKRRRVG